MPGDDPGPLEPAALPAARHWNERVGSAAVAALSVPALIDVARARSTAWAREVLPPVGGSVLDVGCGGGAGSLALVPQATEVIGVDHRGVLLDEFVAAASDRGVARRTVHGAWPDVVATTPVADVALCQHVMQSIDDIVPFVLTLTDRARLAVVAELPAEHPSALLRSLAASLGAPVGDGADDTVRAADLVPVLAELGLAPEFRTDERAVVGPAELARFGESVRAWLGIGDQRAAEVDGRVAELVAGRSVEVLTLRWPGSADPSL